MYSKLQFTNKSLKMNSWYGVVGVEMDFIIELTLWEHLVDFKQPN